MLTWKPMSAWVSMSADFSTSDRLKNQFSTCQRLKTDFSFQPLTVLFLLSLFFCFSFCSETKASYEQPITEEAAPPGNSEVPGNITSVTNHESVSHPALPQLQIQHPQQHVSEQQQGATHLQYQPPSQRGIGLLHPHLPRVHGQPFHRAPMLGPLNALGGIRGLLGQPPLWPGGLGPAGAVPLVWGFQQAAMDFTGPSLLGGYHSPAGPGGFRYRGGQRGGFNGM